MLLQDLIFQSARKHGSNRSLLRGEDVLDYTALAEELHSAAQELVALGLRLGERVGIYLNKRIEGVVALLDLLGDNVSIDPICEGSIVAILQSGAYGLSAGSTAFLSHSSSSEILL